MSSEETAPPPGPVAGRRWLERGREAWRSEIGRIVIVVVATRAAMFALGALVVTLGGGIAFAALGAFVAIAGLANLRPADRPIGTAQ